MDNLYKIIGGDGHEYGPATPEELREWIADGRLGPQSLVQVVDTAQWKPLGAFPEFAPALAAQVRYGPPTPPMAQRWLGEVLSRRPDLRVADCLAQSWTLLRGNLSLLVRAAFLLWCLETICQGLLFGLGDLVFLVLRGVFYGGVSMVFLNRLRGQPASLAGVFSGFRHGFAQLLLAGFVSYLAVFFASCCFFLPGIYLFVAWLFCVPLVADKGLEFWSAMELSRRRVTQVWFRIGALFVLAFLPTLLLYGFIEAKMWKAMIPVGSSMFAPGAVFDLRHFMEALTEAFKTAKITPGLVIAARLVCLLNLPFGLGALVVAYENLFRSGPPSPPQP